MAVLEAVFALSVAVFTGAQQPRATLEGRPEPHRGHPREDRYGPTFVQVELVQLRRVLEFAAALVARDESIVADEASAAIDAERQLNPMPSAS